MKTQMASAVTHEGGKAANLKPLDQLRRSVLACLLWEDTFYEQGQEIGERILELSGKCEAKAVAELAIECRREMNIRHAPLLLVHSLIGRQYGNGSGLTREHFVRIADAVTKRADDLTELLAMYWRKGKTPIANRLRIALGQALRKFDAYQLSKYAAKGDIRLRDVLFLTHAKPKDEEQGKLWKMLADDTLPTADTWESRLSAGADKAESFRGLLSAQRRGGLAVLRNLRNMESAGLKMDEVEPELMRLAPKSGILPFQFVSAARALPQWEPLIEKAMLASLAGMPKIPGKTILLIDASVSMAAELSGKSKLNRLDAAKALAMLARELCEEVQIYSFSDDLKLHPARHGFALGDAIGNCRGGTATGKAVIEINRKEEYDRIIIFTDEQSADSIPAPKGKGFIMNVASYKNSIAYGKWVGLTGFSENLMRYIAADEASKK